MPLDTRTHTVAQFTADFFSGPAKTIDYSRDLDNLCWSEYVGAIAEAGSLLEDAVQQRAADGAPIEDWYDILDEAAEHFAKQLLACRCMPDQNELLQTFGEIIDRHSEQATS